MSTDMQRYSIENQTEAIAQYAARRGLTVVRSYEDAGKSGLRLYGRGALKNLIDDVRTGRADFNVILVYDVSRWGRFQDCDESAYYEFVCKEAGVTVEYCAEQFENDGSLTATVLKNIKRAMAGEFSRELSVKTFTGQYRIAAMGFHRGSMPGYSLRRFLVDDHRNPKIELSNGQRKSIQTDRVILVPGPRHEVETVKYIYRLLVEKKETLSEIARRLNARGITNAHGRPWLPQTVRDVLTNEKYIGNNVFNRTSVRLKTRWRRNPPSQWIRADGAFKAIVSHDLFKRAQHQIIENGSLYTREDLLDSLTALWCQNGSLSVGMLQTSRFAPSQGAYQRCFGSLMNAYRLVGFDNPSLNSRSENLNLRKSLCKEIRENICRNGGSTRALPGSCLFRVNDELNTAVSVVRLSRTPAGLLRWRFGYRTQQKPDILVIARMQEGNKRVRDYFLLPFILAPRYWFTFYERDQQRLEVFRIPTLAPLFELCAREPIPAATVETADPLRPTFQKPINLGNAGDGGACYADRLSISVAALSGILSDKNFLDLLRRENLQTIPRPLSKAMRLQPNGSNPLAFGCGVLEFVIAWSYFSRLAATPAIAAYLNQYRPELVSELNAAFLLLSQQEPFAKSAHD